MSAAGVRARVRAEMTEEIKAVARRRVASDGANLSLRAVARDLGPTNPFDVLGSSIRADQSVVAAIACFASSPDSYPNAITRAIAMGDDTDTVAAMAGAISGAYLGADAVPAHLLAMLEAGPKGRSYIEQLAGRLAELAV